MNEGLLKPFLVVDDDETNRRLLEAVLLASGVEVLTASNGQEALEVLDRERVSVVLLDVMMPVMDGFETLRAIRRRHDRAALPVLMLTSRSESRSVVEAMQQGANDYLTKPFDVEEVKARIKAQLELIEQSQASSKGAFHKLAPSHGEVISGPVAIDAHCPECFVCLAGPSPKCPECNTDKPEGGWPPLAESGLELLGQTLKGKYFVERYVGRGSAGMVYRVRSLDLQRRFAAKLIDLKDPVRRERSDESRRWLRREVVALAQLTNPHVVRINEVLEPEPDLFALIMDYIEGTTLEELLDTGPMAPIVALDIARQIAQGAHEAHERGLIHRDIKPANVMLETLPAGGWFARLLDFGIVKIVGTHDVWATAAGTPSTMSPEQIKGRADLDRRVDIYGLGCMLHHMLTGAPPFTSTNPMTVLYKHLHDPRPRLSDTAPRLHAPGLEDLLRAMMAIERRHRPDDMAQVIDRIDRVKIAMSRSSPRQRQPPTRNATLTQAPRIRANPTLLGGGTQRWSNQIRARAALSANLQALHLEPDPTHGWSASLINFATSDLRPLSIGLTEAIGELAMSSDGHSAAFLSLDKPCVWHLNLADGTAPTPRWPLEAQACAIALSYDASAVVYSLQRGGIFLAEPGQSTHRRLSHTTLPTTCIALSQDGAFVLTGHADGTLSIYPTDESTEARHIQLSGLPTQLAISPLTTTALALTSSGRLIEIALSNGDIMGTDTPSRPPEAIAYDESSKPFSLTLKEGRYVLHDLRERTSSSLQHLTDE